ncbi:uncharacterized protein LOC113505307 [Trichoplusia ni]|uniref:Uncharacterized protein LOC113505307 n=1 Tax=Trichoplusia ni TaxID=7111 RepID=A0A7E5WTY9_TRINI|nr:uncharacterized protein LOC113505307 [Trichoplusia ni]
MALQNFKSLLYIVRMYATRMPEVKLEEARRFMEEIFMSVDVPEREAKAHADLLLHADSVGHNSHGMNRLKFYVNDCKNGACCPAAKPIILNETGATAWVDGCYTLGATTGNFCMDLVIRKAKKCGIGWVAAKNCTHNGMASYWAKRAECHGCIGMAFTNTQAVQVPTRSKRRALGTNPISIVAPANNNDRVLIDLATSTVAMGKIEVAAKKNESIPLGWALDSSGKPTTDSKAALKAALLMPLGGTEKNSGFKGYALAVMVEILCSALSGSNPSHKIPEWDKTSTKGPQKIGHCYAAINPTCFAPGFKDRVSELLCTWRGLTPVDPKRPVLAPGDMERMRLKVTKKRGTVFYPQRDIEILKELAERMPEVKLEEVRRFMEEILMAVDVPEREAKAHADLLLYADSVGHKSHGLNRLRNYVNDCKTGACCPAATPTILNETEATAWVDAGHSLGATTGNFCMDLAIKKANKCGVGWVSAKNCTHNGMAGYWAMQAERQGFIGLTFTNSPPVLVPTRSKERALGTNPIAMAAPGTNGDQLGVDLATSTVALGKIEVFAQKNEPIPLGWALDPDGHATTDAKAAVKAGLLMPLGGEEKNGGFKGYALAVMVEVLCSGLSGSSPSHKIPQWNQTDSKNRLNLGQCYVAINPECFAPGFPDRLSEYLDTLRNLEPADPTRPVIVPGDKARERLKSTQERGTVVYPQKELDDMTELAEQYQVRPLQVV